MEFHKRRNFISLIKNYVISEVISSCVTLPCPFPKIPSSFLYFGQVENIHGTYLKKKLRFVLVSYPHRQSRKRMMTPLLIICRCIIRPCLLRPLLRSKNLYYARNIHPMSSKFHLSQLDNIFFTTY